MLIPRSLIMGLFSMFFVRVAKLSKPVSQISYTAYSSNTTYLRVFRVSCRNLVPGAKLQISSPTEEPPRAS